VVVSKSDKERSIFHCIHYSAGTRNGRKLKPRVVRDEKGKIISQRKRDKYYKKKDCYWLCYYSFNLVNKGEETREWIFTVKQLLHLSSDGVAYLIHINPFFYKVYQKATEEY
jgi:hypothetical protein